MIGRFCLYVEVEGDSVAETIGRACVTIAEEKRWPIRVTGVNYGPDFGPFPGLIGSAGGVLASTSEPDESTQVMKDMLAMAKKMLEENKRGDDWKDEGDES